jgi:hypothetical protein
VRDARVAAGHSEGATDSDANLRAAHRSCNSGRGARAPQAVRCCDGERQRLLRAEHRRWNEKEEVRARTRHGLGFFVRVLVIGTILVAVIAIAGDDELRASLAS